MVLCLFLMVQYVELQCVIVAFPGHTGHTYLLFGAIGCQEQPSAYEALYGKTKKTNVRKVKTCVLRV